MNICFISDTHTQHYLLKLPEADMIIHAGDISKYGSLADVENFLKWFSAQPHTYKIFISGNHDFFFDYGWKPITYLGERRHNPKIYTKEFIEETLAKYPNVIYLNDSSVTIENINIWGSGITPWFHDWAFNRKRGDDIKKHWDTIPLNSDIIITHGPVANILDKTIRDLTHVGCEDLYNKILEVKPKIHVCGHIHEEYSEVKIDDTLYINASVLDEHYNMVNEPIVKKLEWVDNKIIIT